ncbi:hypothetical protein F9C11_13710 [Amycolatopsis sp. VS8301801F10]
MAGYVKGRHEQYPEKVHRVLLDGGVHPDGRTLCRARLFACP